MVTNNPVRKKDFDVKVVGIPIETIKKLHTSQAKKLTKQYTKLYNSKK